MLVVGVFCLNFLKSGGETGHLHGAFFALCADGREDELDEDGEKDQRRAVVVRQLVQPAQQIAERHRDEIRKVKRE